MAIETKNPGKPRQVRGTNAYKYRNLFVFGVFAASGLSWLLFEILPPTKRIVERINNGYWDRTPEENYRLEMIKRNLSPDKKDIMKRKAEILARNEDPIEKLII